MQISVLNTRNPPDLCEFPSDGGALKACFSDFRILKRSLPGLVVISLFWLPAWTAFVHVFIWSRWVVCGICMCDCVGMCTCVHVCVNACGDQWFRTSSSFAPHLDVWDRVSHWTWNTLVELYLLASKLQGSASSRPPYHWDWRRGLLCSAGDLNSLLILAWQALSCLGNVSLL